MEFHQLQSCATSVLVTMVLQSIPGRFTGYESQSHYQLFIKYYIYLHITNLAKPTGTAFCKDKFFTTSLDLATPIGQGPKKLSLGQIWLSHGPI